MGVIGHNHGPSMDEGHAWRVHCWTRARADLLPVLPIEVVRLRVKRAAELGLDYKTYAGVRASTGHDLVAFLFSSNALRASPALPADRQKKLAGLICDRIALVQGKLTPEAVLQAAEGVLDRVDWAPAPLASFAETRARLRQVLGKRASDRVLLVGDAPWEADWMATGRLAGYLPAARYFA